MYNGVAEQMKNSSGTFSYQSEPGHGSPSPQASMAAATRPAVVLTPQ